MTRTVSLDAFFAKYHPAYGVTWEGAFRVLTEGPDRAVVDDLIREYRRDGGFERPVRVHEGGCPDMYIAEGVCSGDPDCCPPAVENGMHRLTALHLMGEPSVEVESTPVDVPVDDEPDPLEVLIILGEGSQPADEATASLFSFRATPDLWVECDLWSWPGPNGLAAWYSGIPDEVIPQVVSGLTERLQAHGYHPLRVRASRDPW